MQSARLSCCSCSEDSLGVIELSCGQLGEGRAGTQVITMIASTDAGLF